MHKASIRLHAREKIKPVHNITIINYKLKKLLYQIMLNSAHKPFNHKKGKQG